MTATGRTTARYAERSPSPPSTRTTRTQVAGCDECLEMVAEDLNDMNHCAGHCLHCKKTIIAVGGVAWRRVVGRPCPHCGRPCWR